MTDTYKNFAELKNSKKEGEDFKIESIDRDSESLVIAIHGGNIEPGTTEVAKAIASDKFSFYSFNGMGTEDECVDLHITSSHFDEPLFCELACKKNKIISIHGERGAEEYIMVGGLDKELIWNIKEVLTAKGFVLKNPPERINGNLPLNVCNRGVSGMGVQLEISRGLRDKLLADSVMRLDFCGSIHQAIEENASRAPETRSNP